MATISSLRGSNRLLTVASAERSTRRLLRLVALFLERTRERQQLRTLDDHELADLGLSREQVMYEVEKSFWQA